MSVARNENHLLEKSKSTLWQEAIERATRTILEYPQGVVCEHRVLCCIFFGT